MIQRFKETPEAGQTPAADLDKLMHIALPIGNGNILMGTDVISPMGDGFVQGNNFHLSIHTESEDETRKLFKALSAGGTVTVPLDKMFWGSFFGMCTDRFGVSWMLSYDGNQQ
ncbi:MAG TPA: VOC family protein [Ohtaekwangia sp.]